MKELEFVNVSGTPWSPSIKARVRVKPTVKIKPKAFHRGWRVEGFPPGELQSKKQEAEEALAEWRGMSEERRMDAVKRGEREPKPWDEGAYVRRAKRTKLRAKPYEIAEAAQQCAEMARRAGWDCVVVIELKQEAQDELAGF